jgi:hypothetical protein
MTLQRGSDPHVEEGGTFASHPPSLELFSLLAWVRVVSVPRW